MKIPQYRIVEVKRNKWYRNDHEFQIQKRFLGFLWWYDPLDDGMYSDGVFKTYEEAYAALQALMSNDEVSVVFEA